MLQFTQFSIGAENMAERVRLVRIKDCPHDLYLRISQEDGKRSQYVLRCPLEGHARPLVIRDSGARCLQSRKCRKLIKAGGVTEGLKPE